MKQIDTTTPCKSLSFAGSSEINLVKPAFTLGYGVAMQLQKNISKADQGEEIQS